mgnify:CR=1 FL=1
MASSVGRPCTAGLSEALSAPPAGRDLVQKALESSSGFSFVRPDRTQPSPVPFATRSRESPALLKGVASTAPTGALIDAGGEVAIETDTYYDVKFPGGTVQPGDWVVFVSQAMADANPGAECATAYAQLSTSAEAPDHGGLVRDEFGEAFAEVILQGGVDADGLPCREEAVQCAPQVVHLARRPSPAVPPKALGGRAVAVRATAR